MSRAAFFIAAIVCASPADADVTYFAAIPDVPIAPGLGEAIDPFGPTFESAGSELMWGFAQGRVPPADVERFYSESLSALGWSLEPGPRGEEMTFFRGRERLVLRVEPSDGGTYLSVRLIVQPASMNAD